MIGTTELIASLDLGTTSARAIIFNAEGRPLAACQKPLTQYFPHDGWVEQDAEVEVQMAQRQPCNVVGNEGCEGAVGKTVGCEILERCVVAECCHQAQRAGANQSGCLMRPGILLIHEFWQTDNQEADQRQQKNPY